jgi:hypothetical protein
MKTNILMLLISSSLLVACSSGSNFTHVGTIKAGRDLNVSGKRASVDMSRSKISVGRDVSICGENGIKTPEGLTAPRDVNLGTGNCSSNTSRTLANTVEEIKRKTDRLDIQEKGGFTIVKPKSRSAKVRLK